ncbi:hypothetical protein [Streptomyces murinus]|uniref:PP2C family protein-serine/threonine phosphatase n=1 Tax=Streptomyces murinus TaxID=33900 RepID=UPI002E0FA270|nr:hypothetical protein OG516_19475 [Streptomyces murinus]
MITSGVATREGTALDNADAAKVYVLADGTVGAAVVDGIGHGPRTSATAPLLAETAARYTAHRGALPGILGAGLLVADRGPDGEEADAVAVTALADEAGTRVAWVGDCRAYGWNGDRLTLYTSDQTMGQWVRLYGPPVEIAEQYDHWVRVSLHSATVASTREIEVSDPLVILTSDGVHDQIDPAVLEQLVADHHEDPQRLAEALVAAAQEDELGYRDDATVVVLSINHEQIAKEPEMSERLPATVLLLVGDQAEITTPSRDHTDPERVSVERLERETGLSRDRLPGAELVAVVGDDGALLRFERP